MVSKKAFAWENFTTLGLCLLVLADCQPVDQALGQTRREVAPVELAGIPCRRLVH